MVGIPSQLEARVSQISIRARWLTCIWTGIADLRLA